MLSDRDKAKDRTANRLRELLIERRAPAEALENFRFHAELAQWGDFRSPGQVCDYLFGVTPLDVVAATKFADYLGCKVEDFSPELQREIDSLAAYSTEGVTQAEKAESRGERLKELAGVIPDWLTPRHEVLKRELVGRIRSGYANAEPPEEIEGVRTGLEYFGVLKWYGWDHALYQFGMRVLDADIEQEITSLSQADQIALLLPLCLGGRDSIEELLTEQSVEDWPKLLLKHYVAEWEEPLRDLVLECVEPRSPHDRVEQVEAED